MADDAKPTPAPETAPAAKAQVSPVAKILAKIDDGIKALKAQTETLTKLRGEVNATATLAKQQKVPEDALLGILQTMVDRVMPSEATPAKKAKGGRPKGSKNKSKNVGGRGKRISEAKIAKIKKLKADGMSNNAIAKKVGTTPKTVKVYVSK